MMLCMEQTLTRQTLPNRDILALEVCPLLGDGGTMDHARAAVAWAIERFTPVVVERSVTDLIGVNEVAALVGTSRAQVLRWANGQGRIDFPDPVIQLGCGAHWSRTTVEQWRRDAFPGGEDPSMHIDDSSIDKSSGS